MLLVVLYGWPDITSGKYAEHDFEIIPIQTTTEIFKASLLNIIQTLRMKFCPQNNGEKHLAHAVFSNVIYRSDMR